MTEQTNIHGSEWQPRGKHRHCRYCGSIHPDDLLAALRAGGVHLDRADMKYGYPHKIYARSPELRDAKFYSEHLADVTDPADFADLTTYLRTLAGVDFVRGEDGEILWRIVAPSYIPGATSGPLSLTALNQAKVNEERAIDAAAKELYAWLARWELPAPDDVPEMAARLVAMQPPAPTAVATGGE